MLGKGRNGSRSTPEVFPYFSTELFLFEGCDLSATPSRRSDPPYFFLSLSPFGVEKLYWVYFFRFAALLIYISLLASFSPR